MPDILTRTEFDTRVDEALGEDGYPDVGEGWYCVSTDMFRCPASGCDFIASHMTAAHLIVVWPEKDDSALLREAHRAQAAGRNPRIVEYQDHFGLCIPFDVWVNLGKPVHGKLSKPDGWPPKYR